MGFRKEGYRRPAAGFSRRVHDYEDRAGTGGWCVKEERKIHVCVVNSVFL